MARLESCLGGSVFKNSAPTRSASIQIRINRQKPTTPAALVLSPSFQVNGTLGATRPGNAVRPIGSANTPPRAHGGRMNWGGAFMTALGALIPRMNKMNAKIEPRTTLPIAMAAKVYDQVSTTRYSSWWSQERRWAPMSVRTVLKTKMRMVQTRVINASEATRVQVSERKLQHEYRGCGVACLPAALGLTPAARLCETCEVDPGV